MRLDIRTQTHLSRWCHGFFPREDAYQKYIDMLAYIEAQEKDDAEWLMSRGWEYTYNQMQNA